MARYEMLWDCPRCDTKGLLGLSHRHCPNCGGAQDPTKRYFPPDDQKVAVEDHPFHGRDLACPACESPNARIASHCVNCGGPLEGAAAVVVVADAAVPAVLGLVSTPGASVAPTIPAPTASAPTASAASAAAPARRRRWWPILLGVVVVLGLATVVCAGVIGFEFFGGKPATLATVGRTWERTVVVETYQTVRDSAWRGGVPAGARGLSCQREQRSTNKVADGQDCRTKRSDHGDGTYSETQECTTRYRSEPVYDEKCTYQVDRWQVVRTERTAGTSEAPTWPAPVVGGTGIGATRAGTRNASYGVTLSNGTTQWPCTVSEAQWTAMTPGSLWVTTMGGLSGKPDCDALARP